MPQSDSYEKPHPLVTILVLVLGVAATVTAVYYQHYKTPAKEVAASPTPVITSPIPTLYPTPKPEPYHPTTKISSLNLPTLKNMDWPIPAGEDKMATLKNGEATFLASHGIDKSGNPYSENGFLYIDEAGVTFGDIDGDGTTDAIALLYARYGGNASFPTVYVVLNKQGSIVTYPTSVKLVRGESINSVAISQQTANFTIAIHKQGDDTNTALTHETRTYKFSTNDLVLQN